MPGSLYLDTSALVKVLNRDLNRSSEELERRGKSRQQIARQLELLEILKKLIVSWGIHPVRESERTSGDGACDVVIGLHSITGLLASRDTPGELDGIYLRRGLELVDESENGVRLKVSSEDKTHVRVGELIAYRALTQGSDWSIGMIRWAQVGADHESYVGVHKLLDNAMAVQVSRIQLGDEPFAPPINAIWTFRRTTGGGEVPSLIVDSSFYRPRESVRVERGSVQQLFECNRVVLSTRCFIWFDVSLSDSTPELTSTP